MNTITVRGNVGKDAELRYTQSGAPVLEVSVADERSKPDGNGGWVRQNTTWWRVKAFGKTAEACAGINRGDRVIVTGRAELSTYEKRDGGEGYSLELLADALAVVPKAEPNRSGSPTRSDDGWGTPAGGGTDEPPF